MSKRGSLHLHTILWAICLLASTSAFAQHDYDQAPIEYSTTTPRDPVAGLMQSLATKSAKLEYDRERGYLPSLLKLLKIDPSSQTLVFSKTSMQSRFISPVNPRAIYFNDHTYVGYIPGSPVLEIASMDPSQGAMFYTIDQDDRLIPRIERKTHDCLQCHDSTSQTGGVPGLVMRSVYPDEDGQPLFAAGTHRTIGSSPWGERWGGWYVTGSFGKHPHMGNQLFEDEKAAGEKTTAPDDLKDVSGRIDPKLHLTPHSDLVAILVLTHQAEAHNLMTRANYAARLAIQAEKEMAESMGKAPDIAGLVSSSRIRSAGEALVRCLLFCDEAALEAPVSGSSDFARRFAVAGLRDSRGRSLRDLDLQKRFLRYPCSYLIYSEQFEALPAPMKTFVYQRLHEVLSGKDQSEPFAHLSREDRQAVLEILRATKTDFPQAK